MPPPVEPQPDSGAGAIVIACFVVLGVGFGLLCTYALFGPGLFVIVASFSLIAGLHYWLWGRTMPAADAGSDDGTGSTDS
jgi:hypothetical protein